MPTEGVDVLTVLLIGTGLVLKLYDRVFRVSAILDLVVFCYICVPCFLFLLFISFASVLD